MCSLGSMPKVQLVCEGAATVRKTTLLRQLLARNQILIAPGAYDVLSSMAAAASGFEAVYMTGSGASTSLTGLPDIGLTTLSEMVTRAGHMAEAVPVPLISDADTGYGNALNVIRTVREFERAGVAGIHLEDQIAPKRCGHVQGKQVVSIEEGVGKIRAAVAARTDPDFVIVVRVDSRAVNGFEDAVVRGRAYREAGADVVFPEALESRDEFANYARKVDGPLFANMTEFGKSPYLSAQELEGMGYRIVIFPVTSMRVALKAMLEFYAELKRMGTQTGYLDRMATRQELYELIDYAKWRAYEKEFVG